MDSVGKEIGVVDGNMDAWYSVTVPALLKRGGRGVLTFYKDSIYDMLSKIYPNYKWEPWRFKRAPRKLFSDPNEIKAALNFVEKQLMFSSLEDWYRISNLQLKEIGLLSLFGNKTKLKRLLREHRPDFPWDDRKFNQ